MIFIITTQDGKSVQTFQAHQKTVYALELVGGTVWSASSDGAVRVWPIQVCVCILVCVICTQGDVLLVIEAILFFVGGTVWSASSYIEKHLHAQNTFQHAHALLEEQIANA